MKILNTTQIREADSFTIANEPISSIDLMERAATRCVDFIRDQFDMFSEIAVVAGPGNNGGDGLVIARQLSLMGKNITVFILNVGIPFSQDFQINLERLQNQTKVSVVELQPNYEIPDFQNFEIVIDAIFGSGLNRSVTGFIAELITKINHSGSFVIAVDIPSGMFADQPVEEKNPAIIQANLTLSLQFPKLMMLLPEMAVYIGELQVIDIGLHPAFIQQIKPEAVLLEDFIVCGLLRRRSKFDHKGIFDHALLIAGSRTKSGAAIMSAQACLRAGAGLLTVHAPDAVISPLRSVLPEAMFSLDADSEHFSQLPEIEIYNSIAIGPGLGKSHETASAFKLLIQQTTIPLVIDADALNILSENPTWLAFLPEGSILTPHIGEFDRLVGKSEHCFQRIQKQKELSKKFGIYLILKGAHTSISCPDGTLYFNNTGNPGMATGGAGDVLTGILSGLLAQGYSSHDAAVLGVYLHGLAGDIALNHQSEESLIATDIIGHLGEAFNYLHETGKDIFGFKSLLK